VLNRTTGMASAVDGATSCRSESHRGSYPDHLRHLDHGLSDHLRQPLRLQRQRFVVATWRRGSGQLAAQRRTVLLDFLYNAFEFVLILGFTYFYTAVVFDPNDVADNLRSRPRSSRDQAGRQTADTWAGS